jgi:ubiquitin-protein ligase
MYAYVKTLFSMFVEPSPDSAVNAEMAQILKDDKPRFDKNAREWTRKYAQ